VVEAQDPDDAKLVTLARSAATRTGGPGAAVRDDIGRTYLAGAVEVAALRLTALEAAVAQAVGSGARRLEAVAVVPARELEPQERGLLVELGDPAVVRQ
jgi:cytidine deaminase